MQFFCRKDLFMGAFGILVTAITSAYILYYTVVITLDLRKERNKQKDEVEVFDTTGLELEDDTVSTNVTEEDGGGFKLNRSDENDESHNQPDDNQETDNENNQDRDTVTDEVIDQPSQDTSHHDSTVTVGGRPLSENPDETDEPDEEAEFSNYNNEEPSDSQETESDDKSDSEDRDTTSPLAQELNDIKDNKMNDIVPEYEGELDQIELLAELFSPLEPHKIKMM